MSAFRTLTATYLRRCVPWSLPMFGILILGPAMVAWAVWTEAGTPGPNETNKLLASLQPLSLYVQFIYLIMIAGGAVAWGPLPDLFHKARISLLPVSNKTLGTFLWLLPACVLMLSNLGVQSTYAWLFGNSWPILTTTICVGVLGTLFTALAMWLRNFRFYQLPLALAAIGAWGYWYAVHLYPNGFRKPPVSWDTFSSTDIVLLIVVAAAAWRLTVTAFTTYRCGEADFGKLLKHFDQPLYAIVSGKQAATVRLPKSDSAFGALLAFEWMKGRRIAIITAGILSCFFCLGVLAEVHQNRGEAITAVFPMMGVFYGLMSGLCLGIGVGNLKSRQNEMQQYYATLPFTDAEISRAAVKTCQRSSLFGSLILASTALLTVTCYSIMVEPVSWAQVLSLKSGRNGWDVAGPMGGILLMLGLPMAAWCLSGMMSAVFSVGRPWVQLMITSATVALMFVVVLLPAFGGSTGQAVAKIVFGCLPFVIIVGTAVLFAMAHKHDLIRSKDMILCGTLAAIIFLSICICVPASIQWKLIWCGVGCLVVTPIAALPLAISSNRHR